MPKAPTVELAPGVWRIPLIGDLVNGFMLRADDGQVTLVDTGVGSSGTRIVAAFTHGPEIRDQLREAIRKFLA